MVARKASGQQGGRNPSVFFNPRFRSFSACLGETFASSPFGDFTKRGKFFSRQKVVWFRCMWIQCHAMARRDREMCGRTSRT